MIALDSNILLRLVTHDDPRQLAAIVRYMEARPDETFWVSDVVMVEVVWALLRLYRWPRANVLSALQFIADKPDLEFEDHNRLLAAIRAFADGDDFADELIVARAREAGCPTLTTFDVAMQKRHPGFAVKPE